MALVVPAAVPSDGNVLTKWVLAIATKTAPSLATEINAASSLDLSCYLKSYVSPEESVEEVEDWRTCLRSVLATPGTSKTTIPPFEVTYDVQTPAGIPNKAYTALAPATTGFLVIRYGLSVDTSALAASQIVDVFPVVVATRMKVAPERNSQLKAAITVMLRDTPAYDAVIAA